MNQDSSHSGQDRGITIDANGMRTGEMEREAIKGVAPLTKPNYNKFVIQFNQFIKDSGKTVLGYELFTMCGRAWPEYKKGCEAWEIYCRENDLVGFMPEDVGVIW